MYGNETDDTSARYETHHTTGTSARSHLSLSVWLHCQRHNKTRVNSMPFDPHPLFIVRPPIEPSSVRLRGAERKKRQVRGHRWCVPFLEIIFVSTCRGFRTYIRRAVFHTHYIQYCNTAFPWCSSRRGRERSVNVQSTDTGANRCTLYREIYHHVHHSMRKSTIESSIVRTYVSTFFIIYTYYRSIYINICVTTALPRTEVKKHSADNLL